MVEAPLHSAACRARPPGPCRVVGVDPSGGRSPWGLAVLEPAGGRGWRVAVSLEAPPREALALLARFAPAACACGVDAPLHPQPPGGFRACERASARLGARLLPGWGGMARLAAAGVAVAALCSEAGAVPVETHPASAARIAGAGGRGGGHAWEALAAAAAAAAWASGRAILVEARDGCLAFPPPWGPEAELLRRARAW